ncbi:MAG: Fe-S cluster domain-containing protein [Firmicutes bacterium]|nr:Fe-S cluster domain-containing protein [Bacillota bacterium]
MSIVILGGLGLVFGLLLGYAALRFAVEEDPRVEAILEALDGCNCGACGFGGCKAYAEAAASGECPPDLCVPGGEETAKAVAEILGKEVKAQARRRVAEVACIGSPDVAHERYEYDGVPDCKFAHNYMGGYKACQYGCLGLGTCVEACPFDAISMGENKLPRVDEDLCTGCGVCVKACPRGVIRLVDYERHGKVVLCNSKDKGKITREVCEVGCIGCKACVKACAQDAIVVEDNLAFIDHTKCTTCGACV